MFNFVSQKKCYKKQISFRFLINVPICFHPLSFLFFFCYDSIIFIKKWTFGLRIFTGQIIIIASSSSCSSLSDDQTLKCYTLSSFDFFLPFWSVFHHASYFDDLMFAFSSLSNRIQFALLLHVFNRLVYLVSSGRLCIFLIAFNRAQRADFSVRFVIRMSLFNWWDRLYFFIWNFLFSHFINIVLFCLFHSIQKSKLI